MEIMNTKEEYMTLLARPNQALTTHLKNVSSMTARFSGHFGADEQGRLSGLLHDLGKAEQEFQKRVNNEKGAKEEAHSHHGAALVLKKGQIWPVAFAINGHHAGLHNRHNVYKREAEFSDRAQKSEEMLIGDSSWGQQRWPLNSFGSRLPEWLEALPFMTPKEKAAKMRAVELYTRFLFSALVDADRLDSEAATPEAGCNNQKRNDWRYGEEGLASYNALAELLALLKEAVGKRSQSARGMGASGEVLRIRQEVFQACEKISQDSSRGIFSLTVPTGGGKTLASMCFALNHIVHQNAKELTPCRKLRRIIIVVPYLNIIQQTVQELKDVFKHTEESPLVLEHHSQVQEADNKKNADDETNERSLRQLAAENWDAPVIITTSVQFFDSLFSRRPSDGRKLHNIAQSVIIFDEVQTFPPRLMQPILDVLGELTNPQRPYGCSLLLCTATQPALKKNEDMPFGLPDIQEIVPDSGEMFKTLKRTTYPELEGNAEIPVLLWSELADNVFKVPNKQALVVVNTRTDARDLFNELRKSEKYKEAVFHMSTWMVPAHRNEVLAEVKMRLAANKPCLLVSTQCVEAGVDLDFPAVWRAFGPYDAIVQAGGRCNRNGRFSTQESAVHVFRPQKETLPNGVYKTAATQTELLRKMGAANPAAPESFEIYFHLLYQLSVPDECEIQKEREELHFEKVHELFKFIESTTVPVLILEQTIDGNPTAVPVKDIYDKAKERVIFGSKEKGYFRRDEWRKVQPYVLNIDLRNKDAQKALVKYALHVFNSNLRIWNAGNAGYLGGLHGTGIQFKPDFAELMQGGL